MTESTEPDVNVSPGDVEIATALNQHAAVALLSAQGKILSANAAFIKMFSAQCNSLARIALCFSSAFFGTTINDWLHPDDKKLLDAALLGWRSQVQSSLVLIRFRRREAWINLSLVGRWS